MEGSVVAQQQKPAAFWIYIGFLVSELLAFVGFVSSSAAVVSIVLFLVAGIWPYLERGRDSDLDTHYQFQIRTFWINVAACVLLIFAFVFGLASSIGAIVANPDSGAGVATGVLGLIGVGIAFVAVSLGLAVWTVVRAAVGLKRLNDGRPIDNPRTWFV